MASTPGHCLARRSGAPYTTASVSADQGSLEVPPAGSAGSLGIAHDVCPDVSYTYCIYRPTVSPLLTPASSRNALLLQSLPTNTPFWQVNSRRRKDDTRVGTAARGIVERLSRLPRRLQSLWVRFLEACFGFFGDGIVAVMSDYRHKRHNVSALIYHIVCPAKYRRVIFDAEVDTVRKDVCLDIAKRYEIAF